MIEKFSGQCFVLDPNSRAHGDSSIGYIGNIMFEDTIDSLISTIMQRRSMRVSSFRLSMPMSMATSFND